MPCRRMLLTGGLATLALSACTPEPSPTSRPSGSGSAASASPSSEPSTTAPLPTTTPWPDLTAPGAALAVVKTLEGVAGTRPVLKLDITRTTVVLTALEERKPRAWRWEAGRIAETTSDMEYMEQSSFRPDVFALGDVGALFRAAAAVSGNASSQELQIVEQNPGSVLMVVTTRPESVPVFFRPDGSLVKRLDLSNKVDLQEALRDVLADRTQVTRVERQRDLVLAESVDPDDAAATLRISRPRHVPAFRTSRAEAPEFDSFSIADIPLDVILSTAAGLPEKLGKEPGEVVTWVMDRRDGRPLPTIRFTLAGQTIVTDLDGRDITHDI